MPYPIVVYCTEEDGGYLSIVPDLPGWTAHGETAEEALHEARIAQDLWLEAARERGWAIPEPTRRNAFRAAG